MNSDSVRQMRKKSATGMAKATNYITIFLNFRGVNSHFLVSTKKRHVNVITLRTFNHKY